MIRPGPVRSAGAACAPEPAIRFNGVVFAIFLLLCLAVNWPGRLNEDSLTQLIGLFNPAQLGDLHSPLSTLLWAVPGFILEQPAAALLIQSVLLAFYAAMLPRPFPARALPLLSAAGEIVIKLSLVVLAGFVIKDILLIGLLLAGLACLQRSGTATRPGRWRLACYCLFALSLVVRPTNFVMIAVAVLVIVPLARPGWRRGFAMIGIALAGLVLTVPLFGVLNGAVLNARQDRAETQLILFDLAGISAQTGQDHVRTLAQWPANLPDPRTCYTPSEAAIMAPWSACRGYAAAGRAASAFSRRTMLLHWAGTIARHPLAYLAHRLDYARNLVDPVGAARDHPVYAAADGDRPGRYLYALNAPDAVERLRRMTVGKVAPDRFASWHDNPVARGFAALTNFVVGFRGTPLICVIICFGLLAWTWSCHWRGRALPRLTAVTAASLGAGNFLMHFFFGVASQERYLYPTIFCALSALLVATRAWLAQVPAPDGRRSEA